MHVHVHCRWTRNGRKPKTLNVVDDSYVKHDLIKINVIFFSASPLTGKWGMGGGGGNFVKYGCQSSDWLVLNRVKARKCITRQSFMYLVKGLGSDTLLLGK